MRPRADIGARRVAQRSPCSPTNSRRKPHNASCRPHGDAALPIDKPSLRSFVGILQADAYSGDARLYLADRWPSPIVEALCWSHGRRKFFELADIAADMRRGEGCVANLVDRLGSAVKRIDAVFDREREINGFSAKDRLAARRLKSAPLNWAQRLKRGCTPTAPSSLGATPSQGHRLHADALAGLDPLSRRRASVLAMLRNERCAVSRWVVKSWLFAGSKR
jgi:hypothetical protein